MAMRKIKDIAVSVGEYNNQQGELKKQWKNVGIILQGDDGRMVIKLDTMPMPKMSEQGYPELWLSCFDPREQQQQPQPQQGYQQQPANIPVAQPAQQQPAPPMPDWNAPVDQPF